MRGFYNNYVEFFAFDFRQLVSRTSLRLNSWTGRVPRLFPNRDGSHYDSARIPNFIGAPGRIRTCDKRFVDSQSVLNCQV